MIQRKSINARLWLIFAMYVIGISHWFLFIKYGNPTFKTADWVCVHQWFDVMRQALLSGAIPYHASYYAEEFQKGIYLWGDRFFAIPYLTMSPHIFLLKFISVPNFMTLQLLFMYTVGFWATCKWINKFNLSAAAACFLWMLLNFNGSIVTKMAVGHLQNSAYMVVPFFLWMIYKFIENEDADTKRLFLISIQYAFFIFFCLLQGSLHNCYQMILVGFFILLFYPRTIIWYIGASVLTVLLGSYLVWPNLFFGPYAGQTSRIIFSGYGTQSGDAGIHLINAATKLGKVFAAPVNIIYHIWESLARSYTAAYDSTWEYSLYISSLGVLLVIGGCVAAFLKYKPLSTDRGRLRFLIGAAIVAAGSIHCIGAGIFMFIQKIIPLPAVDRFASRSLIYPFAIILLLASLGFEHIFKIIPCGMRGFAKWGILCALFMLLMFHSFGWSVAKSEKHYHALYGLSDRDNFQTVIYERPGDDSYKNTVKFSYLASLLLSACAGAVYLYLKKK